MLFGTAKFGTFKFGSSKETWIGKNEMIRDSGIILKDMTEFTKPTKISTDFTKESKVSTDYEKKNKDSTLWR